MNTTSSMQEPPDAQPAQAASAPAEARLHALLRYVRKKLGPREAIRSPLEQQWIDAYEEDKRSGNAECLNTWLCETGDNPPCPPIEALLRRGDCVRHFLAEPALVLDEAHLDETGAKPLLQVVAQNEDIGDDGSDLNALQALLSSSHADKLQHVPASVTAHRDLGGCVFEGATPAAAAILHTLACPPDDPIGAFCTPRRPDPFEHVKCRQEIVELLLEHERASAGFVEIGPMIRFGDHREHLLALVAYLCHVLPLQKILLAAMRAYNYPKHANIYTLHASDMQRVHTAMLDACPALAQRVEKAMRVEAAKMACQQSGKQHCYFKGVYAILISTRISPYDVLGPNPTPAQKRCLSGHGYGMNASKLPHEMLLRADFVAGELPAGVWQEAVPHLHFGHFAVLWAILSIETASCRDAVHICKDVVKHVGCEKLASGVPAVYLARLIADGEFKPGSSDKGGKADELGVAESWRSACCPSDGSWSSVHALANLEVYLPSPLRFMVAPGHFSSLWFPGHRYDAKSDAPERRVWRRFQHACTCSLLSALCIEGEDGDGVMLAEWLEEASEREPSDADMAAGYQWYDSWQNVPAGWRAACAALRENGGRLTWDGSELVAEVAKRVPHVRAPALATFAQRAPHWTDAGDTLSLISRVVECPALWDPAMLGYSRPVLGTWTAGCLANDINMRQICRANKAGRPTHAPAGRATLADWLRLKAGAKTDVPAGPEQAFLPLLAGACAARGGVKHAAYLVLDTVLEVEAPDWAEGHFPQHLAGLNCDSGFALGAAAARRDWATLKMLLQLMCATGLQAPAEWRHANVLLLACVVNWPEGVRKMVTEWPERVHANAPDARAARLTGGVGTPLHWVCRQAASWRANADLPRLLAPLELLLPASDVHGPFSYHDLAALTQALLALDGGRLAAECDGERRTPLFYAHAAECLHALLEHARTNLNAVDVHGLDAVTFRVRELVAQKAPSFDMPLREQIIHILAHPSYDVSRSHTVRVGQAEQRSLEEIAAASSSDVHLVVVATSAVRDLLGGARNDVAQRGEPDRREVVTCAKAVMVRELHA